MAIRVCVCRNEYQDKRYGENRRVVNPRKDGGWRCTCCGKDLTDTTKK